ncbi:MAG: NAD(P)/FAD-dependent oxidoreductase [Candidatus Moraniibacteriota bacterium]
MSKRTQTVILGAGPAGLSAAYEMNGSGSDIVVLEADRSVGGISKTVSFKGCLFDLGGHRFHTDISEVSRLWESLLGDDFLTRPRLSRIRYRGKFFDYPLTPMNAVFGLGMIDSIGILWSYLAARMFPSKEERTFEQWVSNRFGKRLFEIFFKSYTEKVWGIPCDELSAEWAAQRIDGLSLSVAIRQALFPERNGKVKTLIDEFRYPKLGPGMLYDEMMRRIRERGGQIETGTRVTGLYADGNRIHSVLTEDADGNGAEYPADFLISSMPIDELVRMIRPEAPEHVLRAANGLRYRSLVSVNLILDRADLFPDNWIYVHTPEVRLGRVQNFGNWSPFMVDHDGQSALGLEYFCDEGDTFWNMSDTALIALGLEELEMIGLAKREDFVDGFVKRTAKAYPVYRGAYREYIAIIKDYLDGFPNLQTIGRNGMFRYNNMDHSVLTGLLAARNIPKQKNDPWDAGDHDTKGV